MHTGVVDSSGHVKTSLAYECEEAICILLNPWCKEDPVYAPDGKIVQAYVLNTKLKLLEADAMWMQWMLALKDQRKAIFASVWDLAQVGIFYKNRKVHSYNMLQELHTLGCPKDVVQYAETELHAVN